MAAPAQPKKGGKTPLIIVGAIVVVVIVIALLVGLLRGCGGSGNSSGSDADLYNPPAQVYLMTDGDGSGSAIFTDGSFTTIKADVDDGVAAGDGSAIAYIDTNYDLYVTEGDGSGSTKVAERADVIRAVSGTSVVYEDKSDYTLYAYDIASGDTADLGEYDSSSNYLRKFADASCSVAFVDKSGNLMLWADGSDSAEKIASVAGTVEVLKVADDGSIVLWSEIEDGDETLMAYENGEAINLGKWATGASGSYGECYGYINADATAYMITSYYYDEVLYKEVGEDAMTIDMGADLSSTTLSSQEGPFPRIYGTIDSAYALTDDALIYVDFDSGETTEIADYASQYAVRSGTLAYIDGGDLYVADADGKAPRNPQLIGEDVQDMQLSDNGEYAYYMTNDDELYMCRVGDSEAKLVSSHAAYGDNVLTGSIVIADGGSTLYYIEGSSTYTLYSYDYSADESTEVATNLESEYLLEGTNYIGDNDSFYFYADTDTVYVCSYGEVNEVLPGVDDFM